MKLSMELSMNFNQSRIIDGDFKDEILCEQSVKNKMWEKRIDMYIIKFNFIFLFIYL